MQFLLLLKADASLFDPTEVEQVFRGDAHFQDVRFNTPVDTLIECEYGEPGDWTLVKLRTDRESIYFSHTWGAALRAVLAIQHGLKVPMRVYNDDYTFDLVFSDIKTVEELEVAMENAQTS